MPRLGFGLPLVSSAQESPITLIEDLLWEDIDTNNNISVNYQETRTNSVLYSQDTTQAEQWTKTNTAIDSTLYEAPDGTDTANGIKSDSTGTKVYRILQSSLSVTAGKTYTLSVHVKKGTLGFARVQFNDSSVDYSADFNLNTAAITNTSNTIRTQVDSIDNDWYRCSITFQAQNTTSSGVAYVFAQSAAGSSTPNVAVSGVVLLYVWGFQLEENSEPSAYIVTTTEARTATSVLTDFSNVWDFDSADLMPEQDPDGEGAWETFENIVTNGNFATDSDWSKGTGWTISDGKAHADVSSTAALSQTLSTGAGNTYDVTFTISNLTAGSIQPQFGGTLATPTSANSNGTHNFKITATGSSSGLLLYAINTSAFSIDNITIKEYAVQPQSV
jgi:hypothetical protein